MTDRFELRRQSDDLIYRFVRKDREDGLVGFQRTDRDLWIVFDPMLGWISRDGTTGTLTGRVWEMHSNEQPPNCPPEGIWVSRKDAKSYVYQLVHV